MHSSLTARTEIFSLNYIVGCFYPSLWYTITNLTSLLLTEVFHMLIDTNLLVPMTDANQNFSKVVRMVDRDGMAVILKNNQPKYVVVDFSEYDKIAATLQMRKQLIDTTADAIIEDNLEAFLELGK